MERDLFAQHLVSAIRERQVITTERLVRPFAYAGQILLARRKQAQEADERPNQKQILFHIHLLL